MSGRMKNGQRIRLKSQGKPTVTVQSGTFRQRPRERPELNAIIVQIAEAEYERQFGIGQTIDRLRERGGLSLGEVIVLLAEAVCRFAPEGALTPTSLKDPAPLPEVPK